MASVIYEWETIGRRLRLCERGMEAPGWVRLSVDQARWELSGSLQDAAKLAALRGWLVRRSGGLYRPGANDKHMLEVEVGQGTLIVLAQPAQRTALRGVVEPQVQAEQIRPEPRPERAWVDITVIDDGEPARPLAGVGYRLTLPDRSVRTGALGSEGRVREDDVEPGKCWIELDDVRRALASGASA